MTGFSYENADSECIRTVWNTSSSSAKGRSSSRTVRSIILRSSGDAETSALSSSIVIALTTVVLLLAAIVLALTAIVLTLVSIPLLLATVVLLTLVILLTTVVLLLTSLVVLLLLLLPAGEAIDQITKTALTTRLLTTIS